ncbi:rhamnulokinase family protein [Isosphaeraceae bacterium EP7]
MSSTTTDSLAIDLGAESGRGLLGRFDGRRLTLDEVHRFPNGPVRVLDTLHWNILGLFGEIKTALAKSRTMSAGLETLGVDTWGVDFGLVGRGDTLLGNPVHYRDSRTDGVMESAFGLMSREAIYEHTGLQFLPFNTAYQLMAMRRQNSPLLDSAETLLMMPDLIGWMLTGRRAGERTDASTTQLLDPRTGTWSDAVCNGLDIPRSILPDLIEPGTELGPIRPALAEELGLGRLQVIAPATHDTASAVAAVPATGKVAGAPPDWCYLSSGTWSLLGVEVPAPIINAQTLRYNFTNEGGVAGTTRLLKNIMGLWLVQECRRTWARSGHQYDYDDLIVRAAAARPFGALVDPDDPSFLAPGDMPARIAAYCLKTGQTPPSDHGGFVRCAMESLALKYRWTIERMEQIVGTRIKTIHVVGGGTRNALLCQFAADACNRPVYAGPIEATAAGNILLQLISRGKLANLAEAREVVARSFEVEVHEPRNTQAWEDAAGRFERLIAG